jgi:hypothetical protein
LHVNDAWVLNWQAQKYNCQIMIVSRPHRRSRQLTVLVQRGVLVMCGQCLVDPEQLPLGPIAAGNVNMDM